MTTEDHLAVGFIGLGRMGKPMALNLLKAGFGVAVHSRSRGPVDELVAAGAVACAGPAGVADAADVICTCLPDRTAAGGRTGGRISRLSGDRLGRAHVRRGGILPAGAARGSGHPVYPAKRGVAGAIGGAF